MLLFSQNDLFFHELSSQNGLENSKLVFVFKDSRGFNWIGTLGGLYRYDGAEVLKYGQEKGISNPYLQSSMREDQKGNLWFCSSSNLYCYDRLRDSCIAFGEIKNQRGEIASGNYCIIYQDQFDQLWLTAGYQLFRIDLGASFSKKKLILKQYFTAGDQILGKRFLPLLDERGRLNGFFEYRFLGSGMKIWTLDDRGVFTNKSYFLSDPNMNIRQVLPYPNQAGRYIVCVEDGLKIFDTASEKLQALFSLPHNPTFNYTIFVEPYLLLCSTNENLYYFNLKNRSHQVVNDWSGKLNSDVVAHHSFTEIVIDRDGIIWGMVYDEGICFANPQLVKARYTDVGFYVQRLEPINSKEVLIGSYHGLYLFSDHTPPKQIIKDERVFNFYKDDHLKLIWVLTDQNIYQYNPASKQLSLYLKTGFPTMFMHWVSTDQYWLSNFFDIKRLNFKTKKIESISPQFDSLDIVTSLGEDRLHQRIFLHEASKNIFHIFKQKGKDWVLEKSFPLNGTISTYLIPKNSHKLWIVSDNGIKLLHRKSLQVEDFHLPPQWSTSNFTGIVQDERGVIWLSGNVGLMSFTPNGTPLRRHGQKEGFFSAPFQAATFRHLDKDNYIIGGRFGVSQFKINDLEKPMALPRLAVTRFLVKGRPYNQWFPQDTTILEKKAFRLSYHQNSIALRLVGLDFSTPTDVKIQYYLKGQEKENDTPARNQAVEIRYSNLAPGTYQLMARVTNARGIWSNWESMLSLEIRPPFWMRWWFIMLEAVAGVLVVAALAQWYYRAQLREARIRNEEQERILRDIHDLTSGKVVFFQDFQSFADQEIPNIEAKAKALGIAEQALQLFKRISAAVRNNTESDSTLVEFLHQLITESRKNIGTHLQFSVQLDSSIPYSWVSGTAKKHLRLVVQEALGNVLKHAQASSVHFSVEVKEGKLILQIQDDGKGMPEAQIVQIKPTERVQDSGNGLGNMLGRMKSIGGDIKWANSQGSLVVISVSLLKMRPKPKSLRNFAQYFLLKS